MSQHFQPTAYEALPVYQVERGGFYTVTEASIEQGLADGVYKSAYIYPNGTADLDSTYTGKARVALNVPLCGTCSQPLDAGVCDGCRCVYLDAPSGSYVSPNRLSGVELGAAA